jgi:hypothetical protein
MRLKLLIPAAVVLLVSGPSFAQEWIEYASKTDFFSVNFPSEPKVRDITYTTEYDITLPGRVYSVDVGKNHYSVTVVNYSDAQKLHTERQKACRDGGGDGDSCNNPWAGDVRGAMVHAAFAFIQRDAKVTHLAAYNADLVEGLRLQLTNPDRSRTYAVIHMHDYHLYILEGTVAAGQPPPALFQQSLGFLDKEGKRIRYATVYSHGYPVPARTR